MTYTVTVSACSIDSPSDGAGVGDATFCDAPTLVDRPRQRADRLGPRGRAERPRPARLARGRRQPRQHDLQRRRHRHARSSTPSRASARRSRRSSATARSFELCPGGRRRGRSPSTPAPTTCAASASASTGRRAAASRLADPDDPPDHPGLMISHSPTPPPAAALGRRLHARRAARGDGDLARRPPRDAHDARHVQPERLAPDARHRRQRPGPRGDGPRRRRPAPGRDDRGRRRRTTSSTPSPTRATADAARADLPSTARNSCGARASRPARRRVRRSSAGTACPTTGSGAVKITQLKSANSASNPMFRYDSATRLERCAASA